MDPLPRVTPATVDVLRILVASDTPVWGLQIVKSTGRPSGSVYPILERLEHLGWVVSSWEADSSRQGPRRRFYQLQEPAHQAATEAIEALERRIRKSISTPVRSEGLASE